MSRFWTWASWDLDWQTGGWIVFLLYFPVWEAITGFSVQEQLTHHLRPLFLSIPVLWFVGFGLWLWLGIHMFAPTVEEWLMDVAS